MRLELYRSIMHVTYPDEAMTYCYALQPIPAVEQTRGGLLLSWNDDSGPEPFAVIEIPDGSRFTNTEDGWEVLMPDAPFGILLDELLDLAMDRRHGLEVVRGPRLASY